MNASDERKGGISGSTILAVLCGLLVLGALLLSVQKRNQIVPPIPGVGVAPVVPELPGLIARLRTSKSLCEGRAAGAIALVGGQADAQAKLAEGRHLYDETKAESDGCVTFLVTAMTRGFVEADAAGILRLMEGEQGRERAFIAWADKLERAETRTMLMTGPLENLKGLVDELIKRSDAQNAEAVKQLTAVLEGCRMKGWGEIKTAGPSVGDVR